MPVRGPRPLASASWARGSSARLRLRLSLLHLLRRHQPGRPALYCRRRHPPPLHPGTPQDRTSGTTRPPLGLGSPAEAKKRTKPGEKRPHRPLIGCDDGIIRGLTQSLFRAAVLLPPDAVSRVGAFSLRAVPRTPASAD